MPHSPQSSHSHYSPGAQRELVSVPAEGRKQIQVNSKPLISHGLVHCWLSLFLFCFVFLTWVFLSCFPYLLWISDPGTQILLKHISVRSHTQRPLSLGSWWAPCSAAWELQVLRQVIEMHLGLDSSSASWGLTKACLVGWLYCRDTMQLCE